MISGSEIVTRDEHEVRDEREKMAVNWTSK